MAGLLRRALDKEGHAIDVADNGTDALWSATEVDYDAIVLDAMIPAPDGFEVCRELRRRERWAPIIMLTARDGIDDRVKGLDAGADDYLTKPFALAELFARLRSVSRRDPTPRPAALVVPDPLGDLVVDPATHSVQRGETSVDLSPTEFALLIHLARNQGRVVSRSEIIEHVWDFAYDGTSNVVDVTCATCGTKSIDLSEQRPSKPFAVLVTSFGPPNPPWTSALPLHRRDANYGGVRSYPPGHNHSRHG